MSSNLHVIISCFTGLVLVVLQDVNETKLEEKSLD